MNETDIQYPWALLLFFLIPLVFTARSKHLSTVGFSGTALLPSRLQPSFIKRYAEDVLIILVVSILIMALANIRYSSYWQKTFVESKWIMIVQDLSGSMNRVGGEDERMTLGDIAIAGARAFIDMRQEDDLIGLIAFSSFAQLVAPPTFDKAILEKKLELLSRGSDSVLFRELTVGGATNASYAAWLSLCVFFMLLPEEHQPSLEEMDDFRYSLLGKTQREVAIPKQLKRIRFGHGMAIVLFTDGRIEANQSDEDVRKGLPNFANVIRLLNQLGVRVYLIAVDPDINSEVKTAFEEQGGEEGAGRLFYMPTVSTQKVAEVYARINEMEKNKLLVQLSKKKKDTRWILTAFAAGLLLVFCFMRTTPWFRKL